MPEGGGKRRLKGNVAGYKVPPSSGTYIKTCTRVCPNSQSKWGANRQRGEDIIVGRGMLSLVRPGMVQPVEDDEYQFEYCYGMDATSQDIFDRSVSPIVSPTTMTTSNCGAASRRRLPVFVG
eukprot:1905892-Pyramimonas_sp.AAC.1